MKNTVFENWMEYVSDADVMEFKAYLETIAKNAKGLEVQMGVCECGSITTVFQVKFKDGKKDSFPAYHISECTDGRTARWIVEENYEIYIQLLWNLFGVTAFKQFDKCMSYEYYLNSITKLIEKEYGKVPDTGDCETCSMCCHTSVNEEVA